MSAENNVPLDDTRSTWRLVVYLRRHNRLHSVDLEFHDEATLRRQIGQLNPAPERHKDSLVELTSDSGEILAFVSGNFVRYEIVHHSAA